MTLERHPVMDTQMLSPILSKPCWMENKEYLETLTAEQLRRVVVGCWSDAVQVQEHINRQDRFIWQLAHRLAAASKVLSQVAERQPDLKEVLKPLIESVLGMLRQVDDGLVR